MSLRANIDHLTRIAGHEAVYVVSTQAPGVYRGAERWRPVLEAAHAIHRTARVPILRILVGDHTVTCQTEGTETAIVLLPTGHPSAKSLRRTIRRMARRVRKARPTPSIALARAPSLPRPSPAPATRPSPPGRPASTPPSFGL